MLSMRSLWNLKWHSKTTAIVASSLLSHCTRYYQRETVTTRTTAERGANGRCKTSLFKKCIIRPYSKRDRHPSLP